MAAEARPLIVEHGVVHLWKSKKIGEGDLLLDFLAGDMPMTAYIPATLERPTGSKKVRIGAVTVSA